MRIFAFADSHANRTAIDELERVIDHDQPDVIVCAGDYTDFGRFGEATHRVLVRAACPVLYVAGNHETWTPGNTMTDLVPGAVDLAGVIHHVEGVAFCGLSGGDIFTQARRWRVHEVLADLRHHLGSLQPVVFVTHEPPTSWQWPGNEDERAGNPDIADFIERQRPDLVLCGHLHVDAPAETVLATGTRILNPGPLGAMVEVVT